MHSAGSLAIEEILREGEGDRESLLGGSMGGEEVLQVFGARIARSPQGLPKYSLV